MDKFKKNVENGVEGFVESLWIECGQGFYPQKRSVYKNKLCTVENLL